MAKKNNFSYHNGQEVEETILASKPELSRDVRVAEANVPAKWAVGNVILDLYEVRKIRKELDYAEGGFGRVYRVYHRGWDMEMAVKSPRAGKFSTDEQKDNFTRECEAWINLGLHPNIVSCYYVRRLGNIPRVFAEFIEGGSLLDWIISKRLYDGDHDETLKRMLDIVIQIAWGLNYGHEKNLIHRDAKPANILVTVDGVAKVTDFGMANARAEAGEDVGSRPVEMSIQATYGGMTPRYRSPEQAQIAELHKVESDKAMLPKLTRRTDIWSWGLSVLEMFIGEMKWPFGEAAPEVLAGYLERGAEDKSIPKMPKGLMDLLRQCFQHNPDDRPHDFVKVTDALRALYKNIFGDEYFREQPEPIKHRADGLNNQAVSLLDLGQPKEAEKVFEHALALHPDHLESTYNLGLAQWRRGKIDDVTVQKRLGRLWLTSQHWRLAILSAHAALEACNCKLAIETLEDLIEQDIQRPEVQSLLKSAQTLLPTSRVCLRTLNGHIREVSSVVLSTDTRRALSGSNDKTLKLWDLDTGVCLRTFEHLMPTQLDFGHFGFHVGSVALSVDGCSALSGGSDQMLKFWDVATGNCLKKFEGLGGSVTACILSADGRYILSGDVSGSLKLWDIATGTCIQTLKHGHWVESVALSRDGRHALSASDDVDGSLRLWDITTGACLKKFEWNKGCAMSVALSADGRYALSGSSDSTLKLFDVSTGICVRTFEGHTGRVESVALSADGRYALSGSDDCTLKLWDASTGVCLRTFDGHRGPVHSIVMSEDGRHALSGSGDSTLKLWNLGTWISRAPLQIKKPAIPETAAIIAAQFEKHIREAGEFLVQHHAVKSAESVRRARALPGCERHKEALRAWSTLYCHLPRRYFSGGREARTLRGHKHEVTSVALSADGRYILSGDVSGRLKLWDIATGTCIQTLKHGDWVESVALSRDGRHALSASDDEDGSLRLWDITTGACLKKFEWNNGGTLSLVLSADERYALSGDSDSGILKLFDISTGICVRAFQGHDHVESVALSADGRNALAGCRDITVENEIATPFSKRKRTENFTLKLWDLTTGNCLRTLRDHKDNVTSVALSIDGRYALSGSKDKTMKMWDLTTGNCLRTLRDHKDNVTSVALSIDDRYALSGSCDNTVKLWKMSTGACRWTFEGHSDSVTSVALNKDGRFALSGSKDKTLKLWMLDWELDNKEPADWDEEARPYLNVFLMQQIPFAGVFPVDRKPIDDEDNQTSIHRVRPIWNEIDFERLLEILAFAGLGWLRPEGVHRELEKMARNWPPTLSGKN
ncbi:protein kinase [Planctomycetota bacterium]